jgi:hypothetical protein
MSYPIICVDARRGANGITSWLISDERDAWVLPMCRGPVVPGSTTRLGVRGEQARERGSLHQRSVSQLD